jgi:hypothetical protein
MGLSRWTVAAVLLQCASQVLAHGHDEGEGMDMKMPEVVQHNGTKVEPESMASYAGLDKHQTQIYAHIALMVLAWFFVLPVGKSVSWS